MSRRSRRSASAYREAVLKRAAKVLLGSPVTTVEYPGGRNRESFRLILADGRTVIGTRRDTLDRARRECAILEALCRHDARVPALLGANAAQILFQEEIRGVRLSRALADASAIPTLDEAGEQSACPGAEDSVGVANADSSIRVEELLDSALDALDGVHRAASEEGLEQVVRTLGDSVTWRQNLIRRPRILGKHLGVKAPSLDVNALVDVLAVRTPRFIKWDSRPGNALVDESGAVHWFDWEHACNRNRLDDLAWILCDEFVPDAPDVEQRLLARYLPRFSDGLDESDAQAYLAVFGTFHIAVRFGLILKYVDDAWWSLDRCIDEDRVGITLGCAKRLCRRGARWAERNELVRPLAEWFAACEARVDTLVADSPVEGEEKQGASDREGQSDGAAQSSITAA